MQKSKVVFDRILELHLNTFLTLFLTQTKKFLTVSKKVFKWCFTIKKPNKK